MDLAKIMKIESVSRLQPPKPIIVQPDNRIREIIVLMQEFQSPCVLICQEDVLQGIFTERDLIKRVLGTDTNFNEPIVDYMTQSPVTVQTKDSVGTALQRMQLGGHRNLPVVDGNNHPVGILSVKHLVRFLVEYFPSTVYNLPPDPDIVPQAREGA